MQSQVDGSFTCFRKSGSQYHGTPIIGQRDQVSTGILLATTRFKLASDYAWDNYDLGLRLGYVLRGGGPQPDGGRRFIPFHAEARFSYWLGKTAYENAGVQPYFFLGGGLAQVDARIDVGRDRRPERRSASQSTRQSTAAEARRLQEDGTLVCGRRGRDLSTSRAESRAHLRAPTDAALSVERDGAVVERRLHVRGLSQGRTGRSISAAAAHWSGVG